MWLFSLGWGGLPRLRNGYKPVSSVFHGQVARLWLSHPTVHDEGWRGIALQDKEAMNVQEMRPGREEAWKAHRERERKGRGEGRVTVRERKGEGGYF